MKEVFQNYQHYTNWIMKNWNYQTTDLDQEIIKTGLLIEIDNFGGIEYRLMFKSEFTQKEKTGFVLIPTIN